MSNRPFRFVHAADFHLESPPCGVSEIPEHLRDLFVEATYRAVERVFETALSEEAEFLVLSGDILNPQLTGPRGPLSLVEQFERLAEREIAVYWAGGRVDRPEEWPQPMRLPENVHVFPCGRPEDQVHHRDSAPLVRLVGVSRSRGRPIRAADFNPDPAGLYSIAVLHGRADAQSLKSRAIHYWALGGSHTRHTLFSSPHVAHYPGSPQGRCPDEAGPHGCTLVSVDEQQRTRITLVPTDLLRWHNERITVEETTTRADLETRLRERTRALLEAAPGTDLMITWTVAGNGPLLGALRRGKLAGELLAMLREVIAAEKQAAWSISLSAEPLTVLPPEWYEQQTILGDFLREVRHYQMNPEEPLDLESCIGQQHGAGSLGAMVAISDASTRQQVLREAALLGVDLLGGEGPQL